MEIPKKPFTNPRLTEEDYYFLTELVGELTDRVEKKEAPIQQLQALCKALVIL